jgi:predicted 2-oxoglutarate/Fe(II)-dependent dioxygenase YbiX
MNNSWINQEIIIKNKLIDLLPNKIYNLKDKKQLINFIKKRSSWTHKSTFHIDTLPNEVLQFMEQNNILTHKNDMKYAPFSLLKYEEGDFFLNHRDTNMSNEIDGTHEYTCLIFCPYGEDYTTLEGGELMLRHPDGLYEIKFDPAVETKYGRFVMVIFSIDMYHEVLPIIKGTRYVFTPFNISNAG